MLVQCVKQTANGCHSFGVVCVQLVVTTFALSVFSYGILQCIRVRHNIHMSVQDALKCMESDDLLAELLEDGGSPGTAGAETAVRTAAAGTAGTTINKQRARLAALVSGGWKMMFKGHTVTPERIDAMEDAEIEELHARYEARLGAAMSKSLGSSLLHMYASMASMLLPLSPSRQPELVADLEQDPFVSSALQSACCELYYRYGMYLAPLTAALTTAMHCDWGRVGDNAFNENTPTNANDNDGRSERRSEGTGAARASETVCRFAESACETERP